MGVPGGHNTKGLWLVENVDYDGRSIVLLTIGSLIGTITCSVGGAGVIVPLRPMLGRGSRRDELPRWVGRGHVRISLSAMGRAA